MKEALVLKGYEYAKEVYAEQGIDVDEAIQKADAIPVSLQCWQGDDVQGLDSDDVVSGGIAATGNYPGKARTAEELRSDIRMAKSLIPGMIKVNLHASYAEKHGKKIDRDAYTIEQFQGWVDFCKDLGCGMDFNPTNFSHPMMDGNFSLSSTNDRKRKFWIEHNKRCREIALDAARQLGKPCVVNFWMPDGYKDTPADTVEHRLLMEDSLNQIFAEKIDMSMAPCALESKLFGLGVESYTVVSAEFAMAYAIKNNILLCLDAGHFHPTEVISAKISSCLQFLDKLLIHLSRPVRWDSDHVPVWDDEVQRLMDEIILNGFSDRVCLAIDAFDASINRIAAWAIALRNARKALLCACLTPASIRDAEHQGNLTERLALQEERKTLPVGAVWDYYCLEKNVGVREEWLFRCKDYENTVLSARN